MPKKILVNGFLVGWILILLVDSSPVIFNWHREVKNQLDPYLDITGLWIGGWQLFAPEPDKVNSYMSAEVRFKDGKSAFIRSPRWRELSMVQRSIKFREAEYFDKIRLDVNGAAWPALCNYWAETTEHPDGLDVAVREIILKRNWVEISRPNDKNLLRFPTPPNCNRNMIIYAKVMEH